jgi:hypothetical protein
VPGGSLSDEGVVWPGSGSGTGEEGRLFALKVERGADAGSGRVSVEWEFSALVLAHQRLLDSHGDGEGGVATARPVVLRPLGLRRYQDG